MSLDQQFSEIKSLISKARYQALKTVNKELIQLYWKVGEHISNKLKDSSWGDGVVQQLSDYLKIQEPDLKGFDKRGLYRMIQFYETYTDSEFVSTVVAQLQLNENQFIEFVSPVVTQLSWSHHLLILSSCKTPEEKLFYLLMSKKERWSKRDLERQIKSASFERTMLANEKVGSIQEKLPQDVTNIFKDTYILEFLNLPDLHSEQTLRQGLIKNLNSFMKELGNNFLFVGEEFKLTVGFQDFFIDLLFYHRELQCLVAFELKTDKFSPQSLGQLNFYLEALDRDVKNSNENPSIGILLCKGKDDVVVEYALSRTLNPAMIANYQTILPDKQLLHDKWAEILEMTENTEVTFG